MNKTFFLNLILIVFVVMSAYFTFAHKIGDNSIDYPNNSQLGMKVGASAYELGSYALYIEDDIIVDDMALRSD